MARYDYRCTHCGNVFEVTHGMTEHPEVTCPICGGSCEKQFNAAGIEFKGSGFYNTDQRGGTGSTSATMGGSTETAAASKADGGSSEPHRCENCPHKDE